MNYPKKSLGQNFLIDKNISIKIVKIIKNYKNKTIIEIGPGKGALTDIIFEKKPKKIILIEKDYELFIKLKKKYKNNSCVKIYNDDALKFDYSKINKPKSILANLPYNISIKLIINWLKQISEYEEIILMIQKEVAEKMKYYNVKKINRLNLLTAISCNYKIEFDVSKNVFFPKPKVTSSVIKITPKNVKKIKFDELENFSRILFRNKRKMIKNVLPKEIIDKLSLKKESLKILNERAEDLSIEKIIFLFTKLSHF